MTMLILCLACIATWLINSQLRRSMERMQRQRVITAGVKLRGGSG